MRLIYSKKRINFFRAAFFIVMIYVILPAAPAFAVDYDENFTQNIGTEFSSSLIEREGEPRAVFAECPVAGKDIVIYARFLKPHFILTAKIPSAVEKYIDPAVFTAGSGDFKTYKKSGAAFYSRGKAFNLNFKAGRNVSCEAAYIPYKINGRENDAFISDRGFLRFIVKNSPAADSALLSNAILNRLLGRVFKDGTVRLKSKVKYNQYYHDRYDYFGYVNRMVPVRRNSAHADFLLYPTHKITYNRNISDRAEKNSRDMRLAVSFLRRDYPLISQDIRAKNSLVEDHISLDMSKLPQTDIGSGQNTYVYLSYGPGINYYDSPYLKTNDNFPSPRFIFDENELSREDAQFYPKNSWESFGTGISRFNEINYFQDFLSVEPPGGPGAFENYARSEEPAFMAADKRLAYLCELNDKIIDYGLLNDTGELIFRFDFFSQAHRGNVINNELRTAGAVYPAFSSAALIVAPGTGGEYIKTYEEFMKKYGLPEFIGGTHYRDYFIEADECSDYGMRAAYLKYLISRMNPELNRLANLFAAHGKTDVRGKIRPGYRVFMNACENIIKKDKAGFFGGASGKNASRMHGELKEAFYDYLHAVRTEKPKNIQKYEYSKFVNLYKKYRLIFDSRIN